MGQLLVADGVAFLDDALVPVWEKIQADERLSFDDGLTLLGTTGIAALGKMADHAKRKKSPEVKSGFRGGPRRRVGAREKRPGG